MGSTEQLVDVRLVAETELPTLDQTFGSEFDRTHADDLKDQKNGDKSFFVAWKGQEPIGHALIRWLGPRAQRPFLLYPDCPEIYRLAVLEPYQRQGVATAIIERCEEEARARGFRRLGLGTNPDLSEEANLYYRLGYARSDAVRFDESYRKREGDGSVTLVEEKTTFVMKELNL